MEELIIKYIEMFDESPLRICEDLDDVEIIKRLEYCIENNVTMDYFTEYEADKVY